MSRHRDILIVGGGIMGLWGAVKAADAGLSVTLVDRGRIGGGASGGLMGAMFPWMPDKWDAKKQFQYEALTTLPAELARLEAATGLSAGYRRTGRIIPLPKPHLRTIALRHQADALQNWHQGEHAFFWHVSDAPAVAGLIEDDFGAGGYVHDTFAGRAEPRAVCRLLNAWLALQPNVELLEQVALIGLDAGKGRAEMIVTAEGDTRLADAKGNNQTTFCHAVIAAGAESFPILETLLPPLPASLGQGVKGQAALLDAGLDPALPVVFLDGLYIVPHESGHAAVGSTSENTYADPGATDEQLDAVLARARTLMPALRAAPVLERWAGIRPKAIGRDPLVGPLPGHPNVIALTGGFKISFGMAHKLAEAALDHALGREPGLPENFTLQGQLRKEMGIGA